MQENTVSPLIIKFREVKSLI